MWTEKRETGVKFVERYKDHMTGKDRRVSVILDKDTKANRKLAHELLNAKIAKAFETSDVSNLTFKTLIEKYLAYQKSNVKKATYLRNKGFCNRLVTFLSADVLVSNLSARYIREQLDSTGKDNGTKNEYLKRLKALLRWGYRNDYVLDIAYLDKLKKYSDATAKQKVEDKYLELNEINLLLESMKKSPCTTWVDLTEFLILSGLRIGEAIPLYKKDVAGSAIPITKNFDLNNKIVTTPKTPESNRDVFIQDELREVIERIQLYNRVNKVSCRLLFSDNGNYVSYDAYRAFLRRHSQKALGRVITPHALRHTHASLLLANGISIDAISRRLGHVNSEVTREIYLHIMDRLKEKDSEDLRNLHVM